MRYSDAMKTFGSSRIASVDLLRGIVMIIMALDHARDYFTNHPAEPTDVQHDGAALFLTRWVTHFCAPVFIFLAGTSVNLSMERGKTKQERSLALIKRGFWLIILELTLIRFGWEFNLDYYSIWAQVIWVIGWSMIFLAGLIYLPIPFTAILSLVLIFGHNLLDGIHADQFGNSRLLWNFLHDPGGIKTTFTNFYILYPLIPWVGVMAAGFCFAPVLKRASAFRDFWCFTIGGTAILLFIMLRWTNVYGDPHPWTSQEYRWQTVLSFINCEKYPPSLLYLLMTLGPAIGIIPFLEKIKKPVSDFLSVYGRVPLFFYVVHIYLLHSMAMLGGMLLGIPSGYFTDSGKLFSATEGWGFQLPVVYAIWIAAVLLLYIPCKWFMKLKMERRSWWLSYL